MIGDAVVIEGEGINSLIDECRVKFSAYDYLSQSHETRILLIDGASVWRGRSAAAVIVFDFRDITRCRVDIGAAGDAEISWLNKIRDFIKDYAYEKHLRTERIDTNFDSFFVATPTPARFFKKCTNCGKEIPLASEECKYCGARQSRK